MAARETLGSMLQLSGRAKGDLALRRGDIAAQMWNNLARDGAKALQSYQQQQREQPLLDAQVRDVNSRADLNRSNVDRNAFEMEGTVRDQAHEASISQGLGAMLRSGDEPTIQDLHTLFGDEKRAMDFHTGLQAMKAATKREFFDDAKGMENYIPVVATMIQAAPLENQPGLYAAAVKQPTDLGVDVSMIPSFSPEVLERMSTIGQDPEAQPAAPTVGSREDFLRNRYGPRPTPEQLEAGIADYAGLTREPEGGLSKADRTTLVDSVMASPAIWKDLTATLRGDLAVPLAKAGFRFQTDNLSQSDKRQIEQWRTNAMLRLNEQARDPVNQTPERQADIAAQKKLVKESYRVQMGRAGTRMPKPSGATSGGPFRVTLPDGQVAAFPTQEAAAAFKKAAGIP